MGGIAVRTGVLLAGMVLGTASAVAQTPDALAKIYAQAALHEMPGFVGFSAQRGKELFQRSHGGKWSCSTCHTDDPLAAGKHATTGKVIAPLAPAANPERFTSVATADKWFKRNCNDVIGRSCTAQEKGDVLAYLMQLTREAPR